MIRQVHSDYIGDNGVDEKKILYECDITRERGLMVNKYKKVKIFVSTTRGALALHHLGCSILNRTPLISTYDVLIFTKMS